MNTASLAEAWKRLRDGLLREHPDIDPDTLRDSLDGITGGLDAVAALIRESNEDAAQAHGLGEYIAALESRKARLIDRAAKRKAAALTLLQEMGERKLERPEFTASVTPGRPKALVSDADCLPAQFLRPQPPKPDLTAIKDALAAGEIVPGAMLSNAEPFLTVRVR
jgi:hypothetical protein